MSDNELTTEELQAVEAVVNGADVYSYALAMNLRSVEEKAPECIMICDPQMYDGDGTDQVPYFGCIATDEGKRMVEDDHG